MKIDGINLNEGSTITNLTVASGSDFPSSPNTGEFFFRTSADVAIQGLYLYSASAWSRISTESNLIVPSGASFPATAADGQLFFKNSNDGTEGLYFYDTPTGWVSASGGSGGGGGDSTNVTGDVTGTIVPGVDSALTLATIATAGTYRSVTINAKGQVTAGTNPTTLSGYGITDAQPLDADLTMLSGLSGTGYAARTADSTWTTRTILGTTGHIAVTNGNGVTGNTSVDLATVTNSNTGTLQKVDVDNYGRVAGHVDVVEGDLSSLLDSRYLQANQNISVTGDASGSGTTSIPLTLATVNSAPGAKGTASSVPVFAVNGKGLVTAVTDTPIAISAAQTSTGTFADARISSSSVVQHQSNLTIAESQITDGALLARVGSTETITGNWTFNNPIAAADPTLPTHLTTKSYVDNAITGLDPKPSVRAGTTANITLSGLQTVDGVSLLADNRVLVKNQTTASQNGIYTANSGAWVRATDSDTSGELSGGSYIFIEEGTVNGDSGWICTNDGTVTIGSTDLTFVQFTGLGQVTVGSGLAKTGNSIDAATVSNSGTGSFVKIARDGYGRVTGTTPVVANDITTLVGSISPGGSDTQLQFNDSSAFNGSQYYTVATDGNTSALHLNLDPQFEAALYFGASSSISVTIPTQLTVKSSGPVQLAGTGVSVWPQAGQFTIFNGTFPNATVPVFTFDPIGSIGLGTSAVVGTAGQVLTSNGIAAQVTWATIAISTSQITSGTIADARLANIGTAGTYGSVTTDAKGRVTSGSVAAPIANGGTGATSASAALTNLGAYPSANPSGYTSNTGTVTSIDVSGGTTGLTTSGGPVTSSGTVTLSGTLAIANGGTGQTTITAAFNSLDPTTTKGDLIANNGTDAIRVPVGSNAQVLTADSAQAAGLKWAALSSLTATVDVQTFVTGGTWTKPTGGQTRCSIYLLGGGGGGASGRKGSTTSAGGSGGAGAGWTAIFDYPLSLLGATESVGSAAGGTGGAAVTANDTNGNAGGAGGTASFNIFKATGGNGAAAATAANGAVSTGGTGMSNGANSGAGSTTTSGSAASNQAGTWATGTWGGAGGAGGGGHNGTTAQNGGQGGSWGSASFTTVIAGGGGRIANNATDAQSGSTTNAGSIYGSSGGGGGGGSITTGVNGSAGGAGGQGAGGGGGGASLNTANSGAGGNGGNGIVIIVSY